MRTVLKEDFFARSAPEVARDLLGKFVVTNLNNADIASMILETEAYEGPHDLASHASKGMTKRTEIMFGKAGRLYIYLIYGLYFMLNVVTHNEGYPSAVLIRSAQIASGPGRLTKALGITKDLHTLPATPPSGLWFEDRGVKVHKREIERSARIGVAYAGPIWSKKLWRFVYKREMHKNK